MALFADPQDANLRACAATIEEVIHELGHDPVASRSESLGKWPSWSVVKGSARVTIVLHPRVNDAYLRVTAPIVRLDETADKARLFPRLLELNAREIHGAAFAVDNDTVQLLGERTTIDLDRSEVLELVDRVLWYADHYDDLLVAEFGGKRVGPAIAG